MIYLYLYIFLNVVYNKAFENEIIIYNYAVNKYNEKYNCNIEKYK